MNGIAPPQIDITEDLKCYHCHQSCEDEIFWNDKRFCCIGCKTVYQILSEHDLCEYYALDERPGISQRYVTEGDYAYLDENKICRKALEFDSPTFSRVQFAVPGMHCISCFWLLENLHRALPGVGKSTVNFTAKTVRIDFNPQEIKLSSIAQGMARIGYPPQINLSSIAKPDKQPSVGKKAIIAQIAVAGFCFGNVMLFSFPEYLGLGEDETVFRRLFIALNVLLSIPTLCYCAKDYFIAAWQSVKQKQINIDLPIAVGLLVLFFRSLYDVAMQIGPGYFDSFTGLVFFLLIGRWFQSKTFDNLAFDKDYTAYFPLAVRRWRDERWQPVIVYELERGDKIRLKNMDIVPADSLLLDEQVWIDYSFVTGEARPTNVKKGELIYAGGRLLGAPAEMVVEKQTSQSYLTKLWNDKAFAKSGEAKQKMLIDRVAKWFTLAVLALAFCTLVYWYFRDPDSMWFTTTSVLLVACPCALALAAPFTYGNMIRIFGKHGFYLKNAQVVEQMSKIDTIVFDKTGTITQSQGKTSFVGEMTAEESRCVAALASSSGHPLSRLISAQYPADAHMVITSFQEIAGQGVEGVLQGQKIKIGSAAFVGTTRPQPEMAMASRVYVAVNDEVRGYYHIESEWRNGIKSLFKKISDKQLYVLSGDNDAERDRIAEQFPPTAQFHFNQSPHDKLQKINELQHAGNRVMMIGDGLNDAGALQQSDVGVAISDSQGYFSPASDSILDGNRLLQLDVFLGLAKRADTILKLTFAISLAYNIATLSVAFLGYLSPLFSAILMPLSSFTVIGLATFATNRLARALRMPEPPQHL